MCNRLLQYEVGVILVSEFFIFMCPKCRNFTNAPVGQKRRRCSYCGNIIDISKASVVVVDGHEAASSAVKKFNASRGGDEFEKAVERSRERVKALIPIKKLSATDLIQDDDEIPTGKRARLLDLLDSHARENPLSLTKLEELSETIHLDWDWVEKQLTIMANGGVLIFPRPWTVKLVKMPDTKENTEEGTRDISRDILRLLRHEEDGLSIEFLLEYYKEKHISSASVISSLEKLMSAGEIYEPLQGHVRII